MLVSRTQEQQQEQALDHRLNMDCLQLKRAPCAQAGKWEMQVLCWQQNLLCGAVCVAMLEAKCCRSANAVMKNSYFCDIAYAAINAQG